MTTPTTPINTPIRITNKTGRYVIICDRNSEIAKCYEGVVTHFSSTSLQPYYGINFQADGTVVGGKTMTEAEVSYLLTKVAKLGGTVESESNYA